VISNEFVTLALHEAHAEGKEIVVNFDYTMAQNSVSNAFSFLSLE
jgi:hypothetical protein